MSLDELAAALGTAVPGGVERAVAAAELSTYRIGGPLAVLVRVPDAEALRRVGAVLADAGDDVPVLVVGRGSNLLVADTGFAGVAVALTGAFEAVDVAEDRVRAGGAVPLPVLARRAAAAGRTGLEFYVGIPGSVGGAVCMNAGGHGRETREVLIAATVVGLRGDPVRRLGPDDLGLAYRHSDLGPFDVVTDAEFAVRPDEVEACAARLDEVVRWRREHQPGGANGGSVFRNPPGDAAGRLIDAAGCKGLRIGGAVVSEKHANFFQAEAGATAADVAALVDAVRDRVARSSGVVLETELRLVGFAAGG